MIKDKNVLRHHFSITTPKKINKDNQPKIITIQPIHFGKDLGKNMYNVGDVREITYRGTTLTKVKE
jgi:hypothetical protein